MTATPGLDAWAARQESRCACGFHVATQGCHCSGDEWAIFLAALSAAARDGEVNQNHVRPIIRGRIFHKHMGGMWTRAEREGLIRFARKVPSRDHQGRNTHHDARVFAYLPAREQRSAA